MAGAYMKSSLTEQKKHETLNGFDGIGRWKEGDPVDRSSQARSSAALQVRIIA